MSRNSWWFAGLLTGAFLVAAGTASAQTSAAGMTMDICPNSYDVFKDDSPPLTCGCSADAVKDGPLWGANPYSADSGLCRAALQAGAVGAKGGQVVITPAPKTPMFPGITRNGITSRSTSSGLGFRVAAAGGGAAAPPSNAAVVVTSAGTTMDICPNSYDGFKDDSPPLTCGCSADAVKDGPLWGANPYSVDSGLCRAALQAGAVGAKGGQVVITPAPKTPLFPGITRNGIMSRSTTSGLGFRVAAAGGGAVAAVVVTAAGMTMDICPNNYDGFKDDSPPLTCGCSADAVKDGALWGANPYSVDSGICRAALQADVVGAKGGEVVITPAPKTPLFPSITRNGIMSRSTTSGLGFRVAAAAINAKQDGADRVKPSGTAADGLVDSQGRPIQAPIATTLKSAGRVQVYINFVTDSADLQASSGTVLNELLAALTANPKLRIDLIGHTDAVGGSAHNQELSERRAAAVYLWLTQHGVARERLRSNGRGFLEPIAANDTAEGKALNRRVEVKAVN